MTTLFPAQRKLRGPDAHSLWLFMRDTTELPLPTSVTISADGDLHVTLTVDTTAAVDAWADELGTDREREHHSDGTFTDSTTGEYLVPGQHTSGKPAEGFAVIVHVYVPAMSAHAELVS